MDIECNIEVIAFVGPSGTGKSHRALVVAHENDVECIIDDGILIHRNKIVAGSSAKREDNKMKAVRRAIFQDPVQVADVKAKLHEIKPKRLMLLGTSEKMVKQIAKALDIEAPTRYIRIEDVATSREIEKAQYARLKEGKHIIPVPTMELKPHFKGYLIDPLKSIWKRTTNRRTKAEDFEKSVIRPVFSYYGKLVFSDDVLSAVVQNGAKKVRGLVGIKDIKVKKHSKENNGLNIDMAVVVAADKPVKETMQSVQKSIRNEVEFITGMSVERLAIVVRQSTRRKAGAAKAK